MINQRSGIPRLCVVVWLALALAPSAGGQAVLVVDSGGPYTSIQSAIDAAAEGDVVLVKHVEAQDTLHIDGKSLTVVGDPTALFSTSVVWEHALVVTNIASHQSVRIRGMTVVLMPSVADGAATISDSQGPVILENCSFVTLDVGSCVFTPTLVSVSQSAGVTFVRCGIGCFFPSGAPSVMCNYTAMSIGGSDVALYSCVVKGGSFGSPDFSASFGPGGTGLHVSSSTVFLSNTSVHGGAGSDESICCGCPFDGGPGAALSGSSSELRLLDATVSGGPAGGLWIPSPCPPPSPGADLAYGPGVGPGNVLFIPGSSRQFVVDGPLREATPGTFLHTGQVGDFVFWSASAQPAFVWAPAANGVLVTDYATSAFLGLGFLDASATLTKPLVMPLLPPGIDGAVFVAQAGFLSSPFHPGGSIFVLGDPTLVVILDAAL